MGGWEFVGHLFGMRWLIEVSSSMVLGRDRLSRFNLLCIPYSPLFSRDLNFAKIFSEHFAIAEKNCVCREFYFAKLSIK